MEIGNNNGFYVVEFLDPPYQGFDQYVCIPSSWVLMHDESKEIVITKYPVAKSSETEQRVKEGDVSSIDCIYKTKFKYRTDCYEKAIIYIETLKNRVVKERNSSGLMNEDDGENLSSNKTIDESSFNDSVEPGSEQQPLTQVETEIQRRKSNVVKFADANEPLNQTPTSSKSLNDKPLPSTSKRPLDQFKSKGKICNETSNNHDPPEIIDNPGGKTGNESFENKNSPKSQNVSMDSTLVRKPIFGSSDRMNEINRKMLSAQSTPINNTFPARDDSIASTSHQDREALKLEEEEKEDEEREKEKQVVRETKVETGVLKRKAVEIDKREDDENQASAKKKRGERRPFCLPPEYDQYDPRWTWRHRKPSSELVELIEGSGIIVNAAQLINHQRSTKDVKTLAKLLLSEVFTNNALRTCFYNAGQRPGLDESAKAALLEYVLCYARTNNWPEVDKDSIIAAIKNKMKILRNKFDEQINK